MITVITIIAMLILIIGAFNWFSVGVFDFDFVAAMFQSASSTGARVIYALVGIAGLWLLIYLVWNKFRLNRRHKHAE